MSIYRFPYFIYYSYFCKEGIFSQSRTLRFKISPPKQFGAATWSFLLSVLRYFRLQNLINIQVFKIFATLRFGFLYLYTKKFILYLRSVFERVFSCCNYIFFGIIICLVLSKCKTKNPTWRLSNAVPNP